MPEVKYIWVRLSESGAREVKAALEGVAAAGDDIDKDIKIKVRVDDAEKVRLQILRIGDAGDRAGFAAARGMEQYRRSLENLRKTLSDVNAQADKMQAGDGKGGGGIFSKILGGLGGIAGASIGQVPVGAIGLGVAASPAFGSIFGGTMGIIPLLAAATLGVASFGALAYPTFQKVAQAVSGVNTHLSKLSPGMRSVVLGIRGVEGTFSGLAKALGPQVLPVIRDLLPGIRQLIGDMGPFAHAVAPVLDQLAKSFSRFTMSGGFKQFLDQMLKLSGPAVAAIGEGIGKLAVAFGKFFEALINAHALTYLKGLFVVLAGFVQGLGNVIHWLATAGTAVGNFARNVFTWAGRIVQWWNAAMNGVGMALDTATRAIGRFFGTDIPHWIAVGIAWFQGLPGRIVGALGNLGGLLVAAGQAIIQGLINGLSSMLGPLGSMLGSIAGFITSHKGPLDKDRLMLVPAGMAIMEGLAEGLKRGKRNLFNVLADLGISISDQLMDAFMSRNDRRADAAGTTIAAILRARLEQIRAYIVGIAQQEVAWASIVSAATGPGFSNPRWIGPHWVSGRPGTPGTYSHTGAPVGGTPGTRGHMVAGRWAGGNAPPTGAQLLRNLNLDLGRLRAFAHVMARLRRMGLDPVLWQQILAAGPDQGYQIAEAILDAGRGEIWQLNRTENQIYQTGVGLGRTGAKVQFGSGVSAIFNFNGLIAGNPREIAREIWKLLRDLRRSQGGQALGLG